MYILLFIDMIYFHIEQFFFHRWEQEKKWTRRKPRKKNTWGNRRYRKEKICAHILKDGSFICAKRNIAFDIVEFLCLFFVIHTQYVFSMFCLCPESLQRFNRMFYPFFLFLSFFFTSYPYLRSSYKGVPLFVILLWDI